MCRPDLHENKGVEDERAHVLLLDLHLGRLLLRRLRAAAAAAPVSASASLLACMAGRMRGAGRTSRASGSTGSPCASAGARLLMRAAERLQPRAAGLAGLAAACGPCQGAALVDVPAGAPAERADRHLACASRQVRLKEGCPLLPKLNAHPSMLRAVRTAYTAARGADMGRSGRSGRSVAAAAPAPALSSPVSKHWGAPGR